MIASGCTQKLVNVADYQEVLALVPRTTAEGQSNKEKRGKDSKTPRTIPVATTGAKGAMQ